LTDYSSAFVIENEDFKLRLEPYDGYYFIHQDVYRFNKTVKRYTQRIFDRLGETMDLRVFVDPNNTKLLRYSAMYGFEYSYTTTSPDGKEYLILQRT
jgi:hypothetical protein|tara:strand:+ start:808 stop:1098 length:291 start_codon:yes stop_codon:yes gene_type:complete